MQVLPNDWLALMLLVFVLGLKHGMDPDHLATIDGLTRFNAAARPRLSRWSGFLFSAGHGFVVILVAVAVGVMAKRWHTPGWLSDMGDWVSILFLFTLGAVNLRAVLAARPDQVVRPVGLKGRFLGRLSEASHPVLVACVGALFALSFDTISQTALFSLTASSLAGWLFAVVLGLVFTLGMMTTDGINGLWIARLIAATDQRALIASRVMGLTVAILSLLVGLLGVTEYFLPSFAAYTEGRGLLFGLAVVAAVAVSFALALRLSAAKPAVAARNICSPGVVDVNEFEARFIVTSLESPLPASWTRVPYANGELTSKGLRREREGQAWKTC